MGDLQVSDVMSAMEDFRDAFGNKLSVGDRVICPRSGHPLTLFEIESGYHEGPGGVASLRLRSVVPSPRGRNVTLGGVDPKAVVKPEVDPASKEAASISATLRYLRERSRWLECLEVAGVDNWDGYDEALRLRTESEEGHDA